MEESNNSDAIKIRQKEEKELILEQLKRIPIIQVACEKAGVSRATFYRLRNEDEEFKKSADEAMTEGVKFINDMSETQLVSLIKDKNFSALSFWLKNHHKDYSAKLEITAEVKGPKELTKEQQELIEKAIKLSLPKNEHGNE